MTFRVRSIDDLVDQAPAFFRFFSSSAHHAGTRPLFIIFFIIFFLYYFCTRTDPTVTYVNHTPPRAGYVGDLRAGAHAGAAHFDAGATTGFECVV